MFREACRLAADYTTPVVVSTRFLDGRVECGVGAGVILNRDGWILTAAHMLQALTLADQHRPRVEELRTAAARPAPDAEAAALITNVSYWFGADAWQLSTWHLLPEADLAVGRLEGYAPAGGEVYPTFETGPLEPGASVCRLGFPFHAVESSYDEEHDRFTLAPGTLPIPRFPNEGIVTRLGLGETAAAPAVQVRFIETSSPGLRGQSGGPIFDPDGHVWAIQVFTRHLPLGFDPEVETAGGAVREHQFLNVGVGTSSETVLPFLAHHAVEVETVPA